MIDDILHIYKPAQINNKQLTKLFLSNVISDIVCAIIIFASLIYFSIYQWNILVLPIFFLVAQCSNYYLFKSNPDFDKFFLLSVPAIILFLFMVFFVPSLHLESLYFIPLALSISVSFRNKATASWFIFFLAVIAILNIGYEWLIAELLTEIRTIDALMIISTVIFTVSDIKFNMNISNQMINKLIEQNQDYQDLNNNYDDLLTSIPSGYVIFDENFERKFTSKQTSKIFSYKSVDELNAISILDRVYEEDRDKFVESVKKAFSNPGQKYRLAIRVYDASKNVLHIKGFGTVRLDKKSGKKYIAIIYDDITATSRLINKLEKSELKYKRVFENTNVGLAKITRSKIVEVNPYLCKILGYSKDELMKISPFDILPMGDKTQAVENFKKILSGAQSGMVVRRKIIHKDGHEVTAIVQSTRNEFMQDEDYELLLNVVDITDYELMQDKLKSSKEKFDDFFYNNLTGLAISEGEIFVDANISLTQSTGYSKEELKGMKVANLFYEQNESSLQKKLQSLNSILDPFVETTTQILCKNGDIKTFHIRVLPNFDSDNKLVGHYYCLTDITKVVAQEATLNSVLNSIPDGVYAIDRNYEILVVNQQSIDDFYRLTGQQIQSGANLRDYFDEDTIQSWTAKYFQHAFDGKKKSFEGQQSMDESMFSHNIYAPVVDMTSQIIGCLEVSRNITEKVKQDQLIEQQVQELNAKKIELEKYIESNLQLENFAYIASHDLQAPIRTVISFAELLQKQSTPDNPKLERYIDIILESSQNMLSLIEDLLSYSRVNTQKIKLNSIEFVPFLDRMLLALKVEIEESGTNVITENLPIQILGDKTKLEQLFMNLLRNAIKFRKPDSSPQITIMAKEKQYKWQFSIIDNGIGIPPEFHSKIFNLFQKLHSNDDFSGTGLGLTICKKIIEQHNGEIWLESQQGEGTSFHFTLSKKILSSPMQVRKDKSKISS